MSEQIKIGHGEIHMLRLIQRDADPEGWVKVSAVVWPLLDKLPQDFIEKHQTGEDRRIRLTEKGATVLPYLP